MKPAFGAEHCDLALIGRRLRAMIVSGMWATFLVLVPLFANAAGAPGRAAAQAEPRFVNLEIEILPEFDRPAALVILKGELSPGVALPAAISLRIPAASGGASAVAYATAEGGGLFNLGYDSIRTGDYIALRLQAPGRFIHVEFYEALSTGSPDRSYTYVWPGDLAVERLTVRLQEPAGASSISVQPHLGGAAAGPDGLRYRAGELGTVEKGKQVPIAIRYRKTDARTSAELLGKSTPDSTPAPSAALRAAVPVWGLLLAVAAALIAGAGAASLWLRRRGHTGPGRHRLCSSCGDPLAAGARFCTACGAAADKDRG